MTREEIEFAISELENQIADEVEIEYYEHRVKKAKYGDSTAEKNLTILRQLKEKL